MKNTVAPEDVLSMSKLTPTDRLEWLLQKDETRDVHALLSQLLQQYDRFLRTTNVEEKELLLRFKEKQSSREFIQAAYQFGDLVFDAMRRIGGENNRFYRLLIV